MKKITEDALALYLCQIIKIEKASLSLNTQRRLCLTLALYAWEMALSTPKLQFFYFSFQKFTIFLGQARFFLDITQDIRYNCCK